MRVAHYREAFLPSESITETGTTRRDATRRDADARQSGAGAAVSVKRPETGGRARRSRASLKLEIALASTFSRKGIKARTDEISKLYEPPNEL